MTCYTTCALAAGIIIASITILYPKMTGVEEKFMALLTPEQQKIYLQIIHERYNLYVQGTLLGLISGILFFWFSKKTVLRNPTAAICMFVVITAFVQFAWYTFNPKKKWMLDYLTSPEQIDGWLTVYKTMKNFYYGGFFVGVLGYTLLFWGMCRKN